MVDSPFPARDSAFHFFCYFIPDNQILQIISGLEAADASQAQHEVILRDRAMLTSYCYQNPDSKKPGSYGRELTLRADTDKHAYTLRLNPQKGEYNLYCYCYRRDRFDRHLKNAEKGIRFIDPNDKELFRIEDGDKVRYSTRSGETRQMTCRYIDDYHFEANSYRGNNLCHICEFAELYQYHGCHGIIPLRQSLPESCFSTLEATGELIVIAKGEKGYSPTGVLPQDTSPKEGAAALNAANGVTKAQEAAMVAGSMFGWETPAANPKNYDSSFSDGFINRVRIHSPSSPWHRKPYPGKGHPSHSGDAVQTGFSVSEGGPVWERYSGLVLFDLVLAWFGFFTFDLHFLRRPFSGTGACS